MNGKNKILQMKNNVIKTSKTAWVFLVILMLNSCEKTSTEQETTFFDLQGENGFVGAVNGTNAFVSILLGAEEGIAYVCHGEENTYEWFNGAVNNLEEIRFTNGNGAKLTASLIDNAFKGEITFKDGKHFSFNAAVNTEIYGGIYRVIDQEAEKAEIAAGWIVKSEQDQRGALKLNSKILSSSPLSEKYFGEIKDESSNTILIGEKSYPIFRYKVIITLPPLPPSPPGVPIPYPNFIKG